MPFDQSVVFVCTVAERDDTNSIIAMVYGDAPGAGELSVPLSDDGSAPATHYGAHAMMTAAMVSDLDGFKAGTFGGYSLATYGLTEQSAQTAAGSMTLDVSTVAQGHFDSVIDELGLSVVAA